MEDKKNNAIDKVEKIARVTNDPILPTDQTENLNRQDYYRLKIEERARVEGAQAEERLVRARQKEERKQMRHATMHKSAVQRQHDKEVSLQRRLEEKIERQRLKAEQKTQKKKTNSSGTDGTKRGGLITAVVALGVATIALASALAFVFLMPQQSDVALESVYSKSFYDTVEQVDNIDMNLSKIIVTKDTGAMQKYLVDVAINSELAESDIQQLPLKDESKFYTAKLVNQIGDYAKYLNRKIIDGQAVTSIERDQLKKLYLANLELKDSLQQMQNKMGNGFSFSSLALGKSDNPVISHFNTLQNLSVHYPELIYDGPFSDGENRAVKGLSGDAIDSTKAKQIFLDTFASYNLENAKVLGEGNGYLNCYNCQGEINGEPLYAEISKIGGKLVMFSYAGDCNKVVIDQDRAVYNASKFLEELGLDNMKPVWINLSNNLYTINFAYETQGVIVYSDLVKVRVCAETETVIGLEATTYYTNHVPRTIPKPTVSKTTARTRVDDQIQIASTRLALVPVGQTSEKLCYEFYGEYDGSDYYVYIDALTGTQIQMFKVIETGAGKLLI